MLKVVLFGAGRIGAVHAANLAESRRATLAWVVDVDEDAAERLAARYGARVSTSAREALQDPSVDAVVIASSTPAHLELITSAARAGRAIFCEEPIDLDLMRVDRALAEVEAAGVPFFVGFNRRFDPSFQALKQRVARGEVGRVELVSITSRDPAPPSRRHQEASGGLFRDMTIHDLDMARWLLGEEPVEVFATGSALIDPSLADLDDVDTAAVVLRTESGALAQISNSRRAAYGYDQRIEVHGEKGMLRAENRAPTTVSAWSADGVTLDRPPRSLLERYDEAYRAELAHFLTAVEEPDQPLLIGPHDGRQALILAEACAESLRRRRPIELRLDGR
jgi:myo-inositol 2-dehydrogenase/D-chiro-inositol 1-dehydrogenase